jgi:hypothetical protein
VQHTILYYTILCHIIPYHTIPYPHIYLKFFDVGFYILLGYIYKIRLDSMELVRLTNKGGEVTADDGPSVRTHARVVSSYSVLSTYGDLRFSLFLCNNAQQIVNNKINNGRAQKKFR